MYDLQGRPREAKIGVTLAPKATRAPAGLLVTGQTDLPIPLVAVAALPAAGEQSSPQASAPLRPAAVQIKAGAALLAALAVAATLALAVSCLGVKLKSWGKSGTKSNWTWQILKELRNLGSPFWELLKGLYILHLSPVVTCAQKSCLEAIEKPHAFDRWNEALWQRRLEHQIVGVLSRSTFGSFLCLYLM